MCTQTQHARDIVGAAERGTSTRAPTTCQRVWRRSPGGLALRPGQLRRAARGSWACVPHRLHKQGGFRWRRPPAGGRAPRARARAHLTGRRDTEFERARARPRRWRRHPGRPARTCHMSLLRPTPPRWTPMRSCSLCAWRDAGPPWKSSPCSAWQARALACKLLHPPTSSQGSQFKVL